MAGNYPDVPSWRMAYDRDGTQVFKIDESNIITVISSTDTKAFNGETDNAYELAGTSDSGSLVFIFPELRDLDGVFIAWGTYLPGFGDPGTFSLRVSADTTNGLDGTWTTITTANPPRTNVKPAYRTGIVSYTSLAIHAVKFVVSNSNVDYCQVSAVHLYGEIAPAENPNRLALWHPTLDQRITPAYFDWGNVPRSSSADRTFRVKNLSTVQTANSVRVAQEILTDTVPSVVGQHTLSVDGTTFLAQVNVGALAPGAMSGVVTLRRVTPSNAVLSLWAHRVFAEATTWS